MKTNIEQLKKDITDAKARQTEASKDIKRIEKDMSDFSNNKDSKLAELQDSLASLKKVQTKNSISVKTMQKELQSARLEAEQAGADLGAAQDQLTEIDNAMQVQSAEVDEIKQQQAQAKVRASPPIPYLPQILTCVKQDAQDMAQARLDDERSKLTGYDEELKSLEETFHSKSSRITEESLEMQKLAHSLDKSQKEQSAAAASLKQLESEHDWIADERDSFGRANTAYDFQARRIDMAECRASLRNVTERWGKMKKTINPRVMAMIDSVEKKEASLKNMMRTVVRDKRKIEETVATLDEYKREALRRTWSKVNGDFGNIFADLLPGSFARLDPLEGKEISEGLEVKVCLGKVWKQSLTELSGGQRYVIPLSLFPLSPSPITIPPQPQN